MSGEGMPLATVLVADDSEDNRELLTQMLRVQGYRVVCAADGAEALDVLAGQPIDLALVDVMMPRCTGFAVCRTVKARPETRLIPVVLITGLGSADDRIRGIESGADDFLNKPIRKEELLALLDCAGGAPWPAGGAACGVAPRRRGPRHRQGSRA